MILLLKLLDRLAAAKGLTKFGRGAESELDKLRLEEVDAVDPLVGARLCGVDALDCWTVSAH